MTYTAPFQVTATGVVTYVCRSTDGAAVPNIEPDVTFTVYRDLVGPATRALANVTAKAGKRASFRFQVTDVTPRATVWLKVYKGKRLKKTVKVGSRPTGSAAELQLELRPAARHVHVEGLRHRPGRQRAAADDGQGAHREVSRGRRPPRDRTAVWSRRSRTTSPVGIASEDHGTGRSRGRR